MSSEQAETTDSASGGVDRLIERFGGIRPMAAKLDIPVTTVQGWKKRSAIPAARHGDIVGAAERHGISLDGIDLDAVEQAIPDVETVGTTTRKGRSLARRDLFALAGGIAGLFCTILLLVGLYVVKQKTADLSHRVNLIEEDSAQIHKLDARVLALEQRLATAGTTDGVPAGTAGELQGRVTDLSTEVARLSTLAQRVDELQAVSGSHDTLSQTVSGLQGTVATLQGSVQALSQSVEGQRSHVAALDTALNQKKAEGARQLAIVLALGQLRDAAATSQPFDTQLAVARGVGRDDPDIMKQLDSLSAYSAEGVPTLNELRVEFADKASDIVRSNVVGDGKSWRRQALYRLSSVISIRRIGTSSKAQAGNSAEVLVSRAESDLEDDDLSGAVKALDGLTGLPKEVAASWVDASQHRLAVDAALASLAELSIQRLDAAVGPPGSPAPTSGGGSDAQ